MDTQTIFDVYKEVNYARKTAAKLGISMDMVHKALKEKGYSHSEHHQKLAEYIANNSDKTTLDLSKELNLSPSVILKFLRKAGVRPNQKVKRTKHERDIIKLKKQGKTNKEISKELSVSFAVIKEVVKDADIYKTKHFASNIDKRRQEVARLKLEGLEVQDIASELNVCAATVYNDLKAI